MSGINMGADACRSELSNWRTNYRNFDTSIFDAELLTFSCKSGSSSTVSTFSATNVELLMMQSNQVKNDMAERRFFGQPKNLIRNFIITIFGPNFFDLEKIKIFDWSFGTDGQYSFPGPCAIIVAICSMVQTF